MSQVCPWGTSDLRKRKVPALQRQTIWPVGQVVKTAASHAVNIGSNPVRVTIFLLTRELEKFIIQFVFRLLPDHIEERRPAFLRNQLEVQRSGLERRGKGAECSFCRTA